MLRYKYLLISAVILLSLFFVNSEIFAAGTLTPDTNAVQTEHSVQHILPATIMILPFIVLLLMIATGPLFYRHFWEKHYPKVAIILGLITVGYYLFVLHDTLTLVNTLAEYLSFIALLSSLFVASGGILIKVDKKSSPMINVIFLLIGAVISNIIGTTGASMLLIRPYIKMNQNRIKPYHIIFFIFIVSNIGGALTPIGDPPLFLGFLRGVPFFWVIENIWYIWLPTIAMLLAVFYLFDIRNPGKETTQINFSGKIEFKGLKNLGFLAIIIIAVFIDPAVIPGVPNLYEMFGLPFGIREIIMFAVVFISFKSADEEILKANEFDFEPIKEVAFLFIGIFATMIPALQLIAYEARVLSDQLSAGVFFWATGLLSGILDNAPTYLNFLSAAMGKYALDINVKAQVQEFVVHDDIYLQAVSVAAVFFGAMTYIGNGPNFMVKSICERAGIQMPSFFTYIIKYSVLILIPIFIVIWLLFFYAKG